MALSMLVFLLVFLCVVAVHHLLTGWLAGDAARVRKRMAEEFGGEESAIDGSLLFKDIDKLSLEPPRSLDPDLDDAQRPAAEPGLAEKLANLLDRAEIAMAPRQLIVLSAVLAALVALPTAVLLNLWLALGAAAIGAAAPLCFVNYRANAQREKYLKQLPNAFDLMARVIRTGQSVPQSLQAVADAFEDPLAGAFRKCIQQQNLGMRPEITFQQIAERSGILEMRIFAMAMLIQRQTGGNLSEVLERLAAMVRARLKLKQQVRTLTAEGRLQGWTLVVLPFLVVGALMVINRPYVEVLFQNVPLILATLTSMALGMLWIRSIVNIEG
jgi:tight adherence protein B